MSEQLLREPEENLFLQVHVNPIPREFIVIFA